MRRPRTYSMKKSTSFLGEAPSGLCDSRSTNIRPGKGGVIAVFTRAESCLWHLGHSKSCPESVMLSVAQLVHVRDSVERNFRTPRGPFLQLGHEDGPLDSSNILAN